MTDGKLDIVRLQKIVRERVKTNVSLDEIKTQCEATGAFADNLTKCSDTATFAQCVFVKVRNLVMQLELNEYKGDSNNNSNIDDNKNSNTNANTNGANVEISSNEGSTNINENANDNTNTNTNHNIHVDDKNDATKNDGKIDSQIDADTNVNIKANLDLSSISDANNPSAPKIDSI